MSMIEGHLQKLEDVTNPNHGLKMCASLMMGLESELGLMIKLWRM